MEILEAFDLTKSARSAAELAGCDHKTVAEYVARRDAGLDPFNRARRPRLIDPYLDIHRQRAHADHRPHRRGAGPPPSAGDGWPPLRDAGRDLRAVRPRDQGRLGG